VKVADDDRRAFFSARISSMKGAKPMRESIPRLVVVFSVLALIGCSRGFDISRLSKQIKTTTDQISSEMVDIRRDIHSHPELANKESRTAEIVARYLRSYGLEVSTNVGGYGVVGILRCGKKGPVVAYRSDMDALPMEIRESVPYRSTIPGVAHACGHDVHTTLGLGIARVLSALRDELPGTVLFIFQPAEETIEGAKRMIQAGVLDDPKPDAILAVHVVPVEVGMIVTNPGVGLPGVEDFTIRLTGSGDLKSAADHLIQAIRSMGNVRYPEGFEDWQKYFGYWLRKNSVLSNFVLSMVWKERVGENEIVLKGFLKASGEPEYSKARNGIRSELSRLKDGVHGELETEKKLLDMFCDERLASWSVQPLASTIGDSSVIVASNSFPFFGEDFAYFIHEVPGVMFFVGASNQAKGIIALPHSPVFQIDEAAIPIGIKAMSGVLANYLVSPPKGTAR
jgi:metal-dependent amidase/aminoacylase/carboxypeptidase family protein